MFPRAIHPGIEQNTPAQHATTRPFCERHVFPVLKAKQLVASAQRQKIIGEIQVLTKAPTVYFKALYKKLIYNFADFVQVLPSSNESRLCSLLDEGLLRGLYALQFLQEEDYDPLTMYALFSAALLFDVGQVLVDRIVIVSDKEGGFIREWNPLLGVLTEEDGYYKIRRGSGISQWMGRNLTPTIARELLPVSGFNWLASDYNLLQMWLALLMDDQEAGGMFTLYFRRIMSKLVEFRQTQGFIMAMDIDVLEPEETKLGEMFMAWLKDYLRRAKAVNEVDSDVHLLKQGLAVKLGPLVRKFAEEQKRHMVPVAEVGKQLRKLGVVEAHSAVKLVSSRPSEQRRGIRGLFKNREVQKTSEDKGLSKLELAVMLSDIAMKMALHELRLAHNALIKAIPVGPVENNKLLQSDYSFIEELREREGYYLRNYETPVNKSS